MTVDLRRFDVPLDDYYEQHHDIDDTPTSSITYTTTVSLYAAMASYVKTRRNTEPYPGRGEFLFKLSRDD